MSDLVIIIFVVCMVAVCLIAWYLADRPITSTFSETIDAEPVPCPHNRTDVLTFVRAITCLDCNEYQPVPHPWYLVKNNGYGTLELRSSQPIRISDTDDLVNKVLRRHRVV